MKKSRHIRRSVPLLLAVLLLFMLRTSSNGQRFDRFHEAWVRHHDGAGHSFDSATALDMDEEGNIYVTGHTTSAGRGYDILTVKYDSDGNELWAATYDGPDGYNDAGNDIAVDGSGNVFVTGYSFGILTEKDYMTLKYDAAGNQLWSVRVEEAEGAYGLAVDEVGAVYVIGSGPTIKYDTEGNELWRSNVGAISDIAVDPDGNVILVGSVNSWWISYFYTVKYTGAGTPLWSRSDYLGQAFAVAVDEGGNIFATGYWSSEGPSIYLTFKYSPDGTELWGRHYSGPGDGDNYAYDIQVDDQGNVYVTGESERDYGEDEDWATIKYSPSGILRWVKRYDGNSWDEPSAIALDAAGRILVTGYSWNLSDADFDCITIMYARNGDELWRGIYDGPAGGEDRAYDIAIGNQGDVVITGKAMVEVEDSDLTVIKYRRPLHDAVSDSR